MYYAIGASVSSLHRESTDSPTSAKTIQLNEWGCRDGMYHAKIVETR